MHRIAGGAQHPSAGFVDHRDQGGGFRVVAIPMGLPAGMPTLVFITQPVGIRVQEPVPDQPIGLLPNMAVLDPPPPTLAVKDRVRDQLATHPRQTSLSSGLDPVRPAQPQHPRTLSGTTTQRVQMRPEQPDHLLVIGGPKRPGSNATAGTSPTWHMPYP